MPQSEVKDQPGEWRDSAGHLFTLCVIEEISNRRMKTIGADDFKKPVSKQAISVIGGLSVCRAHFDKILEYLDEGKPMTAVMIDALNGELI